MTGVTTEWRLEHRRKDSHGWSLSGCYRNRWEAVFAMNALRVVYRDWEFRVMTRRVTEWKAVGA